MVWPCRLLPSYGRYNATPFFKSNTLEDVLESFVRFSFVNLFYLFEILVQLFKLFFVTSYHSSDMLDSAFVIFVSGSFGKGGVRPRMSLPSSVEV